MAFGEAAVAALPPAVDRDPVLPGADVEPALANLVGRDLVGQRHVCLRVRGHDQPVHPVEQRPVRRVDGVDVAPNLFVHALSPGSVCESVDA
jgi:hypothetical protein